jgi:hypothetical protein
VWVEEPIQCLAGINVAHCGTLIESVKLDGNRIGSVRGKDGTGSMTRRERSVLVCVGQRIDLGMQWVE